MDVLLEGKVPLFLPALLAKPACWGAELPPEAEDSLPDLRLSALEPGAPGAGLRSRLCVGTSTEMSVEGSCPDG